MAIMKGGTYVEGAPKKSRQGPFGKHTKLSATSRNGAKKGGIVVKVSENLNFHTYLCMV